MTSRTSFYGFDIILCYLPSNDCESILSMDNCYRFVACAYIDGVLFVKIFFNDNAGLAFGVETCEAQICLKVRSQLIKFNVNVGMISVE